MTLSHFRSNQIKRYPIPKQVGNRIFVVTPYFTNKEGKLTAEIPDICPKNLDDGESCKISLNHHRKRKTGPCFPIAVVACDSHHLNFTLYPPGHVPYGREPLVGNIAVDGKMVINKQADEHTTDDNRTCFQGSLFDAALDAGDSKVWTKEDVDGSMMPRFNTQLMKLDRASRLLGIHSTLDMKQREGFAEILDLSGQLLIEIVSELQKQPTLQNYGHAICSLLKTIPQNISLFERLTETGSIMGIWPTPYFWKVGVKRLKRSSFQQVRTRGSPS